MSKEPISKERPPNEHELVAFLRSLDARAPEALHAKVQALIEERSGAAARRGRLSRGLVARRSWLTGGVAVACAVVIVLLVSLGGPSPSTPTLDTLAAAALRPATRVAPSESQSRHTQLAASVEGVAFPYWGARFGLRSSGSRTDRIAGHAVQTVFYTDSRGQRIGYSILAGRPAPGVTGGSLAVRGATDYRVLVARGRTVIAWLRSGHLCVIAARGVAPATLLRLARWSTGTPRDA